MTPLLGSMGSASAKGFRVGQLAIPPLTPTSVAYSAISTSAVSISWTLPAGSTGSQVRIYVNGVLNQTTATNATSATVSGLSENTQYSFYVQALRQGLTSTVSNTVQRYTLPNSIQSGITITDIAANDGNFNSNSPNDVLVSWTNNHTLPVNLYLNGQFKTTVSAGNTSGRVTGVPSVITSTITARYANPDNVEGGVASNTIAPAMKPPVNATFSSTDTSTITVNWTNRDLTSDTYVLVNSVGTEQLLSQQTSANGSYTVTGLSAGQATGISIIYRKYNPDTDTTTENSIYTNIISKPATHTTTCSAWSTSGCSVMPGCFRITWVPNNVYFKTEIWQGIGAGARSLWFTINQQPTFNYVQVQNVNAVPQVTYTITTRHTNSGLGYTSLVIGDMSNVATVLVGN